MDCTWDLKHSVIGGYANEGISYVPLLLVFFLRRCEQTHIFFSLVIDNTANMQLHPRTAWRTNEFATVTYSVIVRRHKEQATQEHLHYWKLSVVYVMFHRCCSTGSPSKLLSQAIEDALLFQKHCCVHDFDKGLCKCVSFLSLLSLCWEGIFNLQKATT